MVQLPPTECMSLVLNGVQRAFPSSAQLVQALQWKSWGGGVLKCGLWNDSTVPPKRCRRDTPCEGRGNLSGVPAFDQEMYDDRPPDLGRMSLAEDG